jgi:hypothetical protein
MYRSAYAAQDATDRADDAPQPARIAYPVEAQKRIGHFVTVEVLPRGILLDFDLEKRFVVAIVDDATLNRGPTKSFSRLESPLSGDEVAFAGHDDRVEKTVAFHAVHERFDIAQLAAHSLFYSYRTDVSYLNHRSLNRVGD